MNIPTATQFIDNGLHGAQDAFSTGVRNIAQGFSNSPLGQTLQGHPVKAFQSLQNTFNETGKKLLTPEGQLEFANNAVVGSVAPADEVGPGIKEMVAKHQPSYGMLKELNNFVDYHISRAANKVKADPIYEANIRDSFRHMFNTEVPNKKIADTAQDILRHTKFDSMKVQGRDTIGRFSFKTTKVK